ncbi:MAG: insulinase family protein [Deltaproteobacteria bacterium]|nr:insulinase family protein [Deltaproteobacteria bacterium]
MAQIHKTVLDSGIKVITEEMEEAESSCIGVWVVTGSRSEEERLSGISHFIEHMLFKGTKRRTALDISKEIESVGGMLNAFTSREYTCFYAKVLNKDIPLAIDLLSDIFMNSVFAHAEIAKEKMVVLQEIKMVEDTPDDLIHDIFAARFWQGNPLGRPVLGSSKTVSSITRDDIARHFNRHYGPKNVFIAVAGGARHSNIIRLLKATLGRIKERPYQAVFGRPAAMPGVGLIKKALEQVHLCLGVPVPPQPHPDRYKVYLLNTILGGGMSSRLFQEIREKRGLAYSVYSYLNLCKDAGSLAIYAGTSKEGFRETTGLILKEFAKLSRGVGKEELKNAKSQLTGGMLLGLETSDNRMSKLARDEIYFGRVVPVREIRMGIESPTMADIRDTARRLLAYDKITLVAMGKVNAKDLPDVISRSL